MPVRAEAPVRGVLLQQHGDPEMRELRASSLRQTRYRPLCGERAGRGDRGAREGGGLGLMIEGLGSRFWCTEGRVLAYVGSIEILKDVNVGISLQPPQPILSPYIPRNDYLLRRITCTNSIL